MFGSQTLKKKRMSRSYSENNLAYQNSVSDWSLYSAVKYILTLYYKKTKIYSICLQIRGPSGNRGELENIPEILSIKELKHRGAERVWVQVLPNHSLIMTESSSHTSDIVWVSLGWREERRGTEWHFSVILVSLLGILEMSGSFQ